MPTTWRHLPSSEAEWVLCSTHLFAHHARFAGAARDARKFVYTHTPARYVWTPELDLRGNGAIARAVSPALQVLDRKRAQESHSIAANSNFVAERIARTWDRESITIYPPVSVSAFANAVTEELSAEDAAILTQLPETFLLGASRFVPYKRLDIAIEAGIAADVPVVIAGDGPDEARLRALAELHPAKVTFINRPSSLLLRHLYARALALVFPAIEDFGIMPVEAMASGTPVIANRVGGVSESVIDGKTGVLLDSFDPSSLREAVSRAALTSSADCVARAWQFDESVFDQEILRWVR